jgi:hypothetical protein
VATFSDSTSVQANCTAATATFLPAAIALPRAFAAPPTPSRLLRLLDLAAAVGEKCGRNLSTGERSRLRAHKSWARFCGPGAKSHFPALATCEHGSIRPGQARPSLHFLWQGQCCYAKPKAQRGKMISSNPVAVFPKTVFFSGSSLTEGGKIKKK